LYDGSDLRRSYPPDYPPPHLLSGELYDNIHLQLQLLHRPSQSLEVLAALALLAPSQTPLLWFSWTSSTAGEGLCRSRYLLALWLLYQAVQHYAYGYLE